MLGVVMLIALALFKAASLGISLGGGFFGGPIFPMFFIGGYLGLAVHLLIPAIPVAVEVGAIMASLEAAVALLPLSMPVLMAIMTGSGLDVYGLSWLSRSQRLPYASQSLETRKVTCRGQRWDLLIPGTGPHHTPTYRLQRP